MLAALSLSPAYTLPSSGAAPSSAQPSASSLPPCMAAAAAAADPAEHEAKVAKALKAMTGFANSYVKNTKTKYCAELSIPSVVLKGLAEHKVALGAPLCPCRHYEDKQAEAKDGYWNCPCVPMRERHECHCMLFLTEDNEFVGEEDTLTVEEVRRSRRRRAAAAVRPAAAAAAPPPCAALLPPSHARARLSAAAPPPAGALAHGRHEHLVGARVHSRRARARAGAWAAAPRPAPRFSSRFSLLPVPSRIP